MSDVPENPRSHKEAELEGLRRQTRELQEEGLARIRAYARENPDGLMRLFATAAAGLPATVIDPSSGPHDPHPFGHYFPGFEGRPPVQRPLAELLCVKYGYLPAEVRTERLMSLREFITDAFFGWKHIHFRDRDFQDIRRVDYDAFRGVAEQFSYAIAEAARSVYQGVPLVRDQGGDHELVFEPDPLYSYLALRYKYYDFSSDYSWPVWVQGLYFDRQHLEANKLFFWGGEELSEEQIQARREAFRARIGVATKATGVTAAASPTLLLKRVEAVRSRYYGGNFALGDPDTWPKQATVVAWLMSTHNLSKRLAEAVELVACPDEVRQRR
jgi:hypothetical protein